ncbi:hypothetical protein UQW22_10980 [Isoptericola halotolerans]|uniref:hypothetical protein n=1 Tax=Isoptericola halotolerans TaxID=300560 RepID=UPI003890B709
MTTPRRGVEGSGARRSAVHVASPWRVAWRACGAGFLVFWVLAVGLTALTAGPGLESSTAVDVLWGAGIPAVLVGVPGAALVTALLGARPVPVHVVVFAAGGLLGALLLPARGPAPPAVVAAVGGAAGGRAWVAWRDARRHDPGPASPDPADRTDGWRSPLVWLAATLGLLLLPAWAGFAAVISAAS